MEQTALIESLKADLLEKPEISAEAIRYREAAYALLAKYGLPTPKQEDWKYSNTSALLRSSLRAPKLDRSKALGADQKSELSLPGGEAARLVFIDGIFSAENSALELSSEAASAKVAIFSLRSLLTSASDVAGTSNDTTQIRQQVIKLLTEDLTYSDLAAKDCHKPEQDRTTDGFNFLNSALLGEGSVISVPKGVTLAAPIHVISVVTKESSDLISPLRNLYLLGENSSAQVVESFIGANSINYCTSVVSHIACGRAARFTHSKIQREGDLAYHISRLNITQKEQSFLTSNVFAFGGKFVRNEINPLLDGEGIECHMLGLTTLRGEQQVDNNTVLDHAKPNCFSRELYKGIYTDRSRGVFGGTIIVRPDAQKTNAIQSNQSILLSDSASIDTRPQLKIWADDVKCTHGATVGQLDAEALFYIRSRGVSESSARGLLIHAFASEIVQHLPSPELQLWVEGLLSERLIEMLGSEIGTAEI